MATTALAISTKLGASPWIVDNGSSHRGQRAAARLRAKWRNLILAPPPRQLTQSN
jgi:hypothetical protein